MWTGRLPPQITPRVSNCPSRPSDVIFSQTLNEGTLPVDWEEAQVTPLFEKGDKSCPGNYRPVSLTSVVCKVMKSVVKDRLIDHLTSNNLLSDCHHGFNSREILHH
jgi:hypothetical protein